VSHPLDEYARRRIARAATAAALDTTHIRLGNAKVAIFLAVPIYWAVTLESEPVTAIYLALAAAFIALSVWHERVIRAMARANAAMAFYDAGAARIEDRWMRDEPSGERFRDRDHPYAEDLDLFGARSLFQLLSGCRTPMGEDRLAAWLLQPSPIEAIRERQARVAALRGRIDLRERIAVVNAGRRRAIQAGRLLTWAEQPSSLPALRPLILALALAFLATTWSYVDGGRGIFVLVVMIVNLALLVWLGKRANAIVEELSESTEAAGVELVANVIREIEREPFDDPALAALSRRLTGDTGRMPASRGIARLARITDWADSRHNVFMRLSEIPFLATLQVAYAAVSWRRAHGARLRDWIAVVAEMEALLSLAGFSYEHPGDPFAEIVESETPVFDATDAAHPLIPADTAVSNSLELVYPAHAGHPQVLIVSGSNMSGKSTLMRTAGTNAVLALAGAPVRATRLRLTPLAVGTCLRHTDSLQEHRSGFYTEALRIRLICDLLDGPRPVLFLFDELLSGTNSKDRRIAAEGVVRTMLARRAIGMITTHDLALTEIAAIFPGEVKNVHLQDRVENGQMTFDYKLRDGVITHSNALELMRMIGLDV
jgi:hypothetical protein